MNVQQSVQSIQQSLEEIIKITKQLPIQLIQYKPSEEKWSIIEVLCHLEEALPYWLEEIKRVIEVPGSEWGRGLQHEGRLKAVAEANGRSMDDVLRKLDEVKQGLLKGLSSISDEDLKQEAPSRNPRFGTKPLQFIIDHLLGEHIITHLNQINRNIRQFHEAGSAN